MIIKTLISAIVNVFSKKTDKDIAEINKDVQINNNKTEIRVNEMKSSEKLVRVGRYIVAVVAFLVIIAELFGIRVMVYQKLGIDPASIEAHKILDMLSSILVEVMGN